MISTVILGESERRVRDCEEEVDADDDDERPVGEGEGLQHIVTNGPGRSLRTFRRIGGAAKISSSSSVLCKISVVECSAMQRGIQKLELTIVDNLFIDLLDGNTVHVRCSYLWVVQ